MKQSEGFWRPENRGIKRFLDIFSSFFGSGNNRNTGEIMIVGEEKIKRLDNGSDRKRKTVGGNKG